MKLIHLPFLAMVAVIYALVLYFSQGSVPKTTLLTIITAGGIVVMSSAFMIASKNADPAASAQRFILGTTIQLLLSLAFLAYARFRFSDDFRVLAIHFIILFFCCLVAQSILLVISLRK